MPAYKTALRRFMQTAVIQAGLMLLETGLVLACILWPENKVLPLLAGITAMWALVAFGFAFGRFYKHVIRPCAENEKTVQALARGDFPPPAPPRVREFFPDLSRSINLLRDRLQYLETALRERRTHEQIVRNDDAGIALQARVSSRLLARLYPAIALADGGLRSLPPGPERNAAAGQTARALRELGEIVSALRADTGEDGEDDFDLNIFLRDFDNAVQATLRRRQMSLSCSYGADLPPALHGDRAWLERMLRSMLHLLALESGEGRRLELACTAEGGAVRFTFTDPAGNPLAAEFLRSADADSSLPGEETPLSTLELRLAAAHAERRQSVLEVEEFGESGSRLVLSLGNAWAASPAPVHAGGSRFVESSRHAAPAARHERGSGLVIARDPGFAALLLARDPGAEWISVSPEHALPEGPFRRILAVIPEEIADRHLQTLENALCRAAGKGSAVTVIDPGMHRRFRRHLHESGIRDIADMPALDGVFGVDREAGA